MDALVRPEIAESKQPFAERLGQWLDLSDAMALFSALGGASSAPKATPTSPAFDKLRGEVDRVRSNLADSIRTDGVFVTGKVRVKLPTPGPEAGPQSASDFNPYHRYYLAHQRDMAASIGPLRTSLRSALAQHSPQLKQLASIDAILDQAFATRERNLLATVPMLLAKRYAQLQAAHAAATPPDEWLQPGAWLATFCQDMQSVLLAELELRLQPVLGLLDALSHEVNH